MAEKKKCPYCGGDIMAVAKKCKHCGKWLLEDNTPKKLVAETIIGYTLMTKMVKN